LEEALYRWRERKEQISLFVYVSGHGKTKDGSQYIMLNEFHND